MWGRLREIMKGPKMNMLVPTAIMAVVAIALLAVGYYKQDGTHISGLRSAWTMSWQVLPLLVFAFVTAGMISVLIPSETVGRWVGAESGLRGIVIGMVAGGLTPGGPYVSLPIVAGLLHSGAGMGTTVAYLTSWSLWAVGRLPMEVAILGWRFWLIRFASTFFFPVIAGLLAQFIAKRL